MTDKQVFEVFLAVIASSDWSSWECSKEEIADQIVYMADLVIEAMKEAMR